MYLGESKFCGSIALRKVLNIKVKPQRTIDVFAKMEFT